MNRKEIRTKKILLWVSFCITFVALAGIAKYETGFTRLIAVFGMAGIAPLLLGKFNVKDFWPDKK